MASPDVLIVGGGIMGITAALELRSRGYAVTLIDPGPLPYPLAASTDISKVVRMEYGADELYMQLGEQSIAGWQRWNTEFGETLYYQCGILMLARTPMQSGEYEHDSYQLLIKRGHHPERLTSNDVARRFPAWNADLYVDGFFHQVGGYVLSGRVVELLVGKARQAGVTIQEGESADTLIELDGQVTGVRTQSGQSFHAGHVLVAAGAWTPVLIPELGPMMQTPGMPVIHLKPNDPSLFVAERFPVSLDDIANTGWYGFPLHPDKQVVKFGHHGIGQNVHPVRSERVVTDNDIATLRAFLRKSIPALADAEVVYTRRCLYCDTPDTNFWIDRHPQREGLAVAAGGSGHAFKFGPVLGGLIADRVEGKHNSLLERFRWRDKSALRQGEGDAARSYGQPGR